MTLEIMPVRGVTKNYGVRKLGGAVGQYKSTGHIKTLSFKINREFLENGVKGVEVLNSFVWDNITVISAKLVVQEVFDATSALTFDAGAQGTFPIAAGELNAVAALDITPTGNLAIGEVTTAENEITLTGVVDGGGSAGEAELIVEYVHTALP